MEEDRQIPAQAILVGKLISFCSFPMQQFEEKECGTRYSDMCQTMYTTLVLENIKNIKKLAFENSKCCVLCTHIPLNFGKSVDAMRMPLDHL